MFRPTLSRSLALSLVASSLITACSSDSESTQSITADPSNDSANNQATASPASTFTIGLLPDTQGGTDAEGQAHVALHPMAEVLRHQTEAGVDMVIALGDLTDHGSTIEFAEWRSIADEYAAQGIEFLPVMGNHETSYAYTIEWIRNMHDFIPEDAIHMSGHEWVNYYVIRDNVLVFGLAYYNLPIAFEWIRQVVLEHEDVVDHIVVASHDGLIGAKYGQTREQIVDGTKDDDWVYQVQPQIRDFFAEHDVIYVQGHEHQYQRSLISAKTALTTLPSSSTPANGNYKLDAYTQIMAGNASYKGYEFRYGERDLVQMIVSQKNATMSDDIPTFDVNSSLLSFNGNRVDYESWFATHDAISNDADQEFDADWHLMDRFSRTTDRCGTVVYPDSIPEDTRPVMVLLPEYITNVCQGPQGSEARLLGGVNSTFNRTDSRTRDMSYTPGFSRAETLPDLVRLAYQWLFQYHESWNPNLNGPNRVIADAETQEMLIPETTIDLKEHVTLSWLPGSTDTLSEVLIISGMQNQGGIYQDDYGVLKDIGVDEGLPGSSPDGEAKPPVTLPDYASRSWDINDGQADPYAVEFVMGGDNQGETDTSVILARLLDGEWQPLTSTDCVVRTYWDDAYLDTPPERAEHCLTTPLLGQDPDEPNRWWAVLREEAELALISVATVADGTDLVAAIPNQNQ